MTAPSAEVLKNMIDNLDEKLDAHTKVHTDIFNLLTEIQKELRESNGWKNKFMGALAVILFVVVPIMSWALWEVVHLDDRIDEALANYELEITQ